MNAGFYRRVVLVLRVYTAVQLPEANQQNLNAGKQGLLSRVRADLLVFSGKASWSLYLTRMQ